MQIPGPTMIVNEGDVVTVTLTNNLPVAAGNTSIVFPGFNVAATAGVAGVLTREAASPSCNPTANAGCNAVTYTFTATKPGTYAYYSGTQGDLQIEMGLYGAIIVLPTQTTTFANCAGGVHPNETDFRLAKAAYDHPQSCYDREYLFQLAEMESSIHDAALVQKTACETAIAANANASCAPIAVQSEPYRPNYYLVNGRSMPDDMDADYVPLFPNQPYNGNPHMHPHELVLVRVIGQGRIQHPLHIHGNHARVLARDGNMLLVPNDVNSPLPGGIPRLARSADLHLPVGVGPIGRCDIHLDGQGSELGRLRPQRHDQRRDLRAGWRRLLHGQQQSPGARERAELRRMVRRPQQADPGDAGGSADRRERPVVRRHALPGPVRVRRRGLPVDAPAPGHGEAERDRRLRIHVALAR